jgi:hypothetical protein
MFVCRVLLLTALALFCLAGPLAAQTKFALVFGNKAYPPLVGPLDNPINDSEIVAKALEEIGFRVKKIPNAKRVDIYREVDEFSELLDRAGNGAIGFLYYSGHGVSQPRDQKNYLIPVDVPEIKDNNFWYNAVPLDALLSKLVAGAPKAAHFVVFDACRTELHLPTKALGKGFEAVPQTNGLFVAFSTSPNTTASDVGDSGGPYARILAEELVRPGQTQLDLFQNVKERVSSLTGGQTPWESNGLVKRFYLGRAPDTSTTPPPSHNEAAQAWQMIQFATDPNIFKKYVELYPKAPQAGKASARIRELEKVTTAEKPGSTRKTAAQIPQKIPKHYFIGGEGCLHRTLRGVSLGLAKITCEQSRFYLSGKAVR